MQQWLLLLSPFNTHKVDLCTGFAGGRIDPVAALILCSPSLGWVDLSVINGEVIVENGKLLTLDLQVAISLH